MLFSDAVDAALSNGVPRRCLYLDLDTVIVRSVDALMLYDGELALLGAAGMANEGRALGFNSSVMLWTVGRGAVPPVYAALTRLQPSTVFTVVHRMDHWLEMVVPDAPVIQTLFPGLVVEFASAFGVGVASGRCGDGVDSSGGCDGDDGGGGDGGSGDDGGVLTDDCSVIVFPLYPKPHDVAAPVAPSRFGLCAAECVRRHWAEL
jgi:hypothetical protein